MKVKTTPARAYTLDFQKGVERKTLINVPPELTVGAIKHQQAKGYVLTCVTAERW